MQLTVPEISVKVFISYAHADQELRKKLDDHLSALKYSKHITIWQDQEIPPGMNWEDQINTHLDEADMILLLVSSSFLASNYCWNKEVQAALERHKAGTARVIPIILRPVHWQSTPLGQLQALPTEAKPVTRWDDHDAALEDVVRGIRDVAENLRIKLQEDAENLRIKLQEDAQRKAKIQELTRKIEKDLYPVLDNITRELSFIANTSDEQNKKKRSLEAEINIINSSIEELKVQYNNAMEVQSLGLEKLIEINKELHALGGINPYRYLIIDSRPFEGRRGRIWRVPYDDTITISDLQDSIYFKINEITNLPAYTYGKLWILEDQTTGHQFIGMGTSWARKRKMTRDDRKLREVGIEPGMILAVQAKRDTTKRFSTTWKLLSENKEY